MYLRQRGNPHNPTENKMTMSPSTYRAATLAQIVVEPDSFQHRVYRVHLEHTETATDSTVITEDDLRVVLGFGEDDYVDCVGDATIKGDDAWLKYLDRCADRLDVYRATR